MGLIDIIVPMSDHLILLAPALAHPCVFLARARVFFIFVHLYNHDMAFGA